MDLDAASESYQVPPPVNDAPAPTLLALIAISSPQRRLSPRQWDVWLGSCGRTDNSYVPKLCALCGHQYTYVACCAGPASWQKLCWYICRYNNGLMEVTRLIAADEFSSAADFAAAAAVAGVEDQLGCDARTAEGGCGVVLSRR